MAPFNMRCNVCGEYIYKGKKFNSRKENVDDENYLGLRIFRFYIRCPKCVAEIAFKTDLKNTDYTLEAGATRLFQAEKLAQQMAEQERLEKEADELNPMKVLENRTKASHKEMAQIDELEELREISARHAKVDTSVLLEKQKLYEEHLQRLQQEEEDHIIESIFGSKQQQVMKRLADSDSDDSDDGKPKQKKPTMEPVKVASDLLVDPEAAAQMSSNKEPAKKTMESWQKSVGSLLPSKKGLASLVRKKPAILSNSSATSSSATCASSAREGTQNSEGSNTLVKNDGAKTDGVGKGVNTGSKGTAVASSSGVSAPTSALSMLGDYSDSNSAEDSS